MWAINPTEIIQALSSYLQYFSQLKVGKSFLDLFVSVV